MKVLNTYAGLGGNRKYWDGCSVTAVEIDERIAEVYQQSYPNDKVIVGDAHEFLLKYAGEFDFVWSSPPCQTHTRMMRATKHKTRKYVDMALYQEILFLQHFFKWNWVVENVKPFYEPLIKPTAIIGRHCVWSNRHIKSIKTGNHENFIRADSPKEIESLKKWLGIQYEGNIYYKGNHSPGQVLRNCVHPDLGLYIFNCVNQNKQELFNETGIFKTIEETEKLK